MELKKYTVIVARFNPERGLESGEQFALPVDSPDAEHAVSAAMSNAIAFTSKVNGMTSIPVAFVCTGITERQAG